MPENEPGENRGARWTPFVAWLVAVCLSVAGGWSVRPDGESPLSTLSTPGAVIAVGGVAMVTSAFLNHLLAWGKHREELPTEKRFKALEERLTLLDHVVATTSAGRSPAAAPPCTRTNCPRSRTPDEHPQ